mmetsp:Transcript_29360/g.79487  ORF Transcript_29360/g.79487 Transcript_29360/m.79487 type:complete len:99 (+) Transcript_29360:127-423(+)
MGIVRSVCDPLSTLWRFYFFLYEIVFGTTRGFHDGSAGGTLWNRRRSYPRPILEILGIVDQARDRAVSVLSPLLQCGWRRLLANGTDELKGGVRLWFG